MKLAMLSGRKWLLGVSILGALAMAASACGGADPTATRPPQPTATRPPAATTAPQATAPPQATTAATATRPPATTTAPTAAPTATRPPAPTAAATATVRPTAAPTVTAAPAQAAQLRLALPLANTGFVFVDGPTSVRVYGELAMDYFLPLAPKGELDSTRGFFASWSSNADASVWTFKTRQGVVFHNGDAATPQDVKYTMEFNIREGNAQPGVGEFKALLKSIETPDSSTVVVNLTRPDIFFALTSIAPVGSLPSLLLPKNYLTAKGPGEFNKAPIGSGPYKVRSIALGDRITFDAVDRHWAIGVPRFKTVQVLLVPETATRLALLKSGGVEAISATRNASKDLRSSGFTLYEQSGAFVAYVNFYQQYLANNPVANAKVREALSIAINRQLLVDTFMQGLGKVTNTWPAMDWDAAHINPPIPQYNPARAKQLLAEAGHPNGFTMLVYQFEPNDFPEALEIIEAISTMWEAVGIKVNRRPMLYRDFIALWFAQKFDTVPAAGGMMFTDKRVLALPLVRGCCNPTAVARVSEDKELRDLGDQVAASKNQQEYAQNLAKFQTKYSEQHISAALFEAGAVYAGKADLGTWEIGRTPSSINLGGLVSSRR